MKDPASQGPPYAAPSHAYFEHLSRPGEEIPYDSDGKIAPPPPSPTDYSQKPHPLALERILHWQPERTYETGKDQNTGEVVDRLSIWRRRE